MFSKSVLRTLIASLSLANLLFLKLWMKLLPYNKESGSTFFLPSSPFDSYLAAMLNVLIWGIAFFLLLHFTRNYKIVYSWIYITIFSLVTIAAVYGVGNSYLTLSLFIVRYGHKSVIYLETACVLVWCAWMALIIKYCEKMARLCAVIPLLFAPLLPVTFGEATMALFRMEPAARFHPHRIDSPSALHNPLGVNVVWMIFDEMDYRLNFKKRPSWLSLPAFDAFRKNALFASSAYSPSNATHISLPALLTGIPLQTTVPVGARRLDLLPVNSSARLDFSAQETVFDRIKMRQGSTALFGWFFPYSRVMHSVDLCRDYPRYSFFTSDNLLKVIITQWVEIWDIRFLPFSNTLLGNNHIGIITSMQSDVIDTVKHQEPSFMFLHYPIPHYPNIYNRKSGTLAFNRNSREGYFDNMVLADRLMGELRSEMERKGSWDRALVIISADHHWRNNTYDGQIDYEHVPFMVKFPHQNKGITYEGKFNTVLTQGLVLAVLDGKVKTPEDASLWLDQNSKKSLNGKAVFSINQPDTD
jgi:hypothetical protein